MDLSCPACGRDDAVQKATAIVYSGTATQEYAGSTNTVIAGGFGLGVGRGYASFSGSSQTHLATRLAPPPLPIYDNPWKGTAGRLTGCAFIGAAILLPIGAVSGEALVCGAVFALCFIVLTVALTLQGREARRVYNAAQGEYLDRVLVFKNSYYCYRCDDVFIPAPLMERIAHKP